MGRRFKGLKIETKKYLKWAKVPRVLKVKEKFEVPKVDNNEKHNTD